jgi:hypothetical protein
MPLAYTCCYSCMPMIYKVWFLNCILEVVNILVIVLYGFYFCIYLSACSSSLEILSSVRSSLMQRFSTEFFISGISMWFVSEFLCHYWNPLSGSSIIFFSFTQLFISVSLEFLQAFINVCFNYVDHTYNHLFLRFHLLLRH